MERNNNGKLAIAIVAMFVVALSVVGFTYAYFTATVTGNTDKNKATITAGELKATYIGKNGDALMATNIVPDWVSDGKHFYDPTYAFATDKDGKIKIVSCDTDNTGCHDEYANANYGLTNPIKFTVESDTDVNDVYYAVQFEVIATDEAALNIEGQEAQLIAHLYKGEGTTPVNSVAFNAEKAGNGKITLSTKEEVLAPEGTQDYRIEVEYKNVDEPQETISFAIRSSIVGIANKLDENGAPTSQWVDASDNVIIK